METRNLFNHQSKLYASARPQYPPELFKWLASVTPGKEIVWDCGTGTGQAAIGLSKYFAKVEATDISPRQIENAFDITNVRYRVMPAEKTDFPDRYFDAINVALALHWFDLKSFWEEVKRVIKPGGLFVTYWYDWPTLNEQFDNVFKKVLLEPLAPFWSPKLKLCWNAYAHVDFPFERIKTPEFEIQNQWSFVDFSSYVQTWSAMRAFTSKYGQARLKKIISTLQNAWGPAETPRTVRLPLKVIAGYIKPE